MRKKANNLTKTELSSHESNWQFIATDEEEQSVSINDNVSVLQVQLEICQSKAFLLMTEKEQLTEMLKQRDADAETKIKELAKMGELIIFIDSEKANLNQKLIDLNAELNNIKEVLTKTEQQNRLLIKSNTDLQESLAIRFKELAGLAKLLEVSERALMAREGELEFIKGKLEKFKNTLSWKAAKPARMISARLRRNKKGGSHEQHLLLIEQSGFFDEKWYSEICPELTKIPLTPIEHYLSIGFKMGLNPSERFDGNLYLERYPDVAQEGLNPLIHYILFGKNEGRII